MWLWDMLRTLFEEMWTGLVSLLTLSLHLPCEMQDVIGAWSVVPLLGKRDSRFRANALLIDDKTVAKMGHPNLLWGRPRPPAVQNGQIVLKLSNRMRTLIIYREEPR
jgi:hypothetical protein